jgi:glycosyltransferase involved in cell wall biosynthesis
VVHGWPPWTRGGAEHHAAWLAQAQAARDAVTVYAGTTAPDRIAGDAIEHRDVYGVRVRLVVDVVSQRDPIARAGLRSRRIVRDFARFLDEIRPDLVHVHHLAGPGASLLGVAARHGAPIVYQAHDWWPICARGHLRDRDGAACPGPQPLRCARCLPLTALPLGSTALYAVRRHRIARQLRHVRAVVSGSRLLVDGYTRWRVLPAATPVHVVPYGVPVGSPVPRATGVAGRPVRIGVVGALRPHKGVHVALDAFAAVAGRAELHIWGASDDPRYTAALDARAATLDGAHVHGPFEDDERAGIFRDLDVLVVPSMSGASLGLVAREAWRYGVPVVASRGTALTELIAAEGAGGTTVEPGDAAALGSVLRAIVDDPATLDRWRGAIPAVPTIEAHAAAIDAIYDGLLAGR